MTFWRASLAPAPTGPGSPVQVPTPSASHSMSGSTGAAPLHTRCDPGRQSWAQLMRRVFAIDVLECPACGGRMRVIAAIEDPQVVRAILRCLGLPARAPPLAAAHPIEQQDLPFPDDA